MNYKHLKIMDLIGLHGASEQSSVMYSRSRNLISCLHGSNDIRLEEFHMWNMKIKICKS